MRDVFAGQLKDLGIPDDTRRKLMELRRMDATVAAIFKIYELGGFKDWDNMLEALVIALQAEKEQITVNYTSLLDRTVMTSMVVKDKEK